MSKFSLYFALLLLGITAVITQVILIRELIVIFSGNELSIGIILANWLILEAAGSFFAGRWAIKFKSGYLPYTLLQWLLALTLPLLIYLARIVRLTLDLVPGEGINIITIFYTSFLLLIPIGLITGAQFSFGCKLLSALKKKSASLIGQVYVFEAIGSVIGGIFATYLCLQYLNAMETVFILSFLNVISALFLLSYSPNDNKISLRYATLSTKVLHAGLLIILLIITVTGKIDHFHKESIKKQWPDYQIISYKNSVYGNVAFLERADQLHLLSNGVSIATLPTPEYAQIEDLSHFPLLFHPNPKKIFLLGGGLAGLIDELLKYQVESIDYAELDPLLIKTVLDFAPTSSVSTLNSKLINTHYVDGRYFLRVTEEKYDVIILNLPDPSTLVINRFYTTEFFDICQSRLRENGILVFQIPGSASYMNTPLAKLSGCLIESISEVFMYHRVIPFEKTMVLASNEKGVLDANPDLISFRLAERQVETRLFSDLYIKYKLDSTRIGWFQNGIENIPPGRLNTDLLPTALYYDLIFWNSSFSPKIASFYTWFEKLTIFPLLIIILFIFITVFIGHSKGKLYSKSPLIISIFSTGFVGMGLTIILVLTFQAYYGYVYYWIGLIITAFMVGLSVGGLWGSRQDKRYKESVPLFHKIESSISIYLLILVVCLASIQSFSKSDLLYALLPFFVLLFTFLCGSLVGAQFPIANMLYLDNPQNLTKAAGVIYASDLVGAWAGGIIITLILIPILGTIDTAIILFTIKLGSTIIFRYSRL
jgi:spermidine synthase